MPDAEKIEKIKQLHQQMERLTLQAGVGPKRYASLATRLENKLGTTVSVIHDFLLDTLATEYREVERIWTLPAMSEEVWDNYFVIFNDTEFEEVTLLRKARKALKSKYAKFFQSKKREHNEVVKAEKKQA